MSASKGFYVTLRRAGKTAWLLGPFAEHEQAIRNVEPAVAKACELDQWAWFDPFGTASMQVEGALPPGKLNHLLPHLLETEASAA